MNAEWFASFSGSYADGVTAIAASLTAVMAGATLLYLKKEFFTRYRPYVFPAVNVDSISDTGGLAITILPRNVGPHPCKARLVEIRLLIGDESYDTPDMNEPMIMATHGVGVLVPAGHISQLGVTKIREGRYERNRRGSVPARG